MANDKSVRASRKAPICEHSNILSEACAHDGRGGGDYSVAKVGVNTVQEQIRNSGKPYTQDGGQMAERQKYGAKGHASGGVELQGM